MLAQQDPGSWTWAVITMTWVGGVLALGGVGVVVLAKRTADGRIGRNRWVGVRTRTARSSEDAWLAAQAASCKLSIWAGWAMVVLVPVAGVVGVVMGDGEADRALAWWGRTLGFGTVAVCAALIVGAFRGHRAAVRVRDGSPPVR